MLRLLLLGVPAQLPLTVEAQTIPGLGGNVGSLRTEAAAYRAQVREILGRLTAELGDSWDDSNAAKPAAFYDLAGVIILGPAESIEGRAAIRKAFEVKLGKMRGVTFTVQGFDMSDELAYVRGTMSYELLSPEAAPRRETAGFAMTLRTRRGDWMIQSHTIAGIPILPE